MITSADYESVFTSPFELSRMMLDPGTARDLSDAFNGMPVSIVLLRHYLFISQNLEQLRMDTERHRTERQTIYQLLIGNQVFEERLFPVLMNYRRRQNRTHSPSHQDPPSSPVSRSPNRTTDTYYSPSPNTDSPQTIPILSAPSSDEEDSIDSIVSFYSADSTLGNSPTNPINIDRLPELPERRPVPPPVTGMIHRTRSTPIIPHCNVCTRNGHFPDNCILRGPSICTYCREVGHVQGDCPKLRRDLRRYNSVMQFCIICSQPGHSLENCMTLQGYD